MAQYETRSSKTHLTPVFTFDKRRNTTIKGGRILEAAKNRLGYVHIWKLNNTENTKGETCQFLV